MIEPTDEILVKFDGVNVWKRRDERAPHKPLLILLALARVQRQEPRLVEFKEIEPRLVRLLRDFGPPRKSVHPEFPFWYLQNDDVWELPQREALVNANKSRGRTQDVQWSLFKSREILGGFPSEIDTRLRNEPALVHEIAARVLSAHFPTTLHEDILDAVGLQWEVLLTRRPRDPGFRDEILRAYEHRCAVCGFDGRLGLLDLALEAAHVRWHMAGGPDSIENGLALCTFHHKIFDRGALGLNDEHCWIVSQEVNGQIGVQEGILRFHRSPARRPQQGLPLPDLPFVRWHRKEVFREPARLG